MTTHLLRPPVLGTPLPSRCVRDGTPSQAVYSMAVAPISAAGQLFGAFIHRLERHRMKRALHAMSDRLLADIGICRGEIDAAVDQLIPPPHRRSAR
jgi:uncharacterized protein YjiS (DUF1127 family)